MSRPTREIITGITGPMKSGKTGQLIELATIAKIVGKNVQVFKPDIDTRFLSTEIRSRNGASIPALPIARAKDIMGLLRRDTDLVVLDEAQFLDAGLLNVVLCLTEEKGIEFAFSALKTDFRGEPFPTTSLLLPIATRLVTVYGSCEHRANFARKKCGEPASMTQRLVNGRVASYNDPVLHVEKTGEEITYQARCYKHWDVKNLPNRQIR